MSEHEHHAPEDCPIADSVKAKTAPESGHGPHASAQPPGGKPHGGGMHKSGSDHDAPTVGSAAALAGIKSQGRQGVAMVQENPHYQLIGGEAAIRQLVDRFYYHMDTRPQAQTVRAMHEANLAPTKDVLVKFLSGWLGGPQLYAAERGQPRLRKKHLPFAIGDAERDAWMDCMTAALADVVPDAGLRAELTKAFYKTAHFLRNQPGENHDHHH